MAAQEVQHRGKDRTLATRTRFWLPVAMALLLVGWGANQFASMLAFYQQTFGFSQIEVTSMLGIYVGGLIPALLLGGQVSDRLGRKGTSITALVITVIASVAMIFGSQIALLLYIGRFLAGVATGAAMAAATAWVKELSQGQWDPAATAGAGARRASLFSTAGFWLGPVASGLIANFAPWPEITPYVVHIVLCVPLFIFLAKVPGLRQQATADSRQPNEVPAYISEGAQQRFRRVVTPGAFWVFGAGTIGFAVVPSLFNNLGELTLIYSTIAVALTLGFGVAVQPLARKLDSLHSARASAVALSMSLLGLLVALGTGVGQWPWIGLLACCLLGAGYGLMLVAGLLETQRLSSPQRLGSATGKFYTLAYGAYLAPTVIAFVALWVPVMTQLLIIVGLAVGCMLLILLNYRHGLERPESVTQVGAAQHGK